MEREAHSTWLCTAPLSLQHCRENPCQNIPPRPGNPFFFFKFLKKYQFTDLKQGVPWGGGLCVGCLWGWGCSCTVLPCGARRPLGLCQINRPLWPARGGLSSLPWSLWSSMCRNVVDAVSEKTGQHADAS